MHLLKKIFRWFSGSESAQASMRGASTGATANTADPDAHARLVREAAAHVAAGRLAEAERALIDALSERHDDADALLLQGLVLKQQGRLEEAIDSLLLAAHFRPDLAEAHYQLGLIVSSQGGLTGAEQHYRRALGADPRHAQAYVALGALLVEREALDEAVDCFRAALGIHPDYAQAHSNLGLLMAARLDRFSEAAPHLQKAWRLAPDDPNVMCNWAMYLHQRGELDESIALLDRLIEADATDPIPRLNRALARLKMGDFSRGWVDYEARKQAGWPYSVRAFAFPEWKGGELVNRKILVHAEQGLGDQIMFASCFPELMAVAGHCVIECAPKLEALFRRSFSSATVMSSTGNEDGSSDEKFRGIDCYVAMGSLPLYFRKGWDAFPVHRGYLRADPQQIAAWRRRLTELPGRHKIGITWRGGASSTRRSVRSVALDQWLPLLRHADTTFVSLQYTDCREELEQIRRDHGIQIHHWQEAIDDYDQTAALVSALDLVVSVQTAIVHLGGALGRPVWVMVPAVAEWRYLQSGERLPWYPAVRLFRQSSHGEWGPVVDEMVQALTLWAAGNGRAPNGGT